MVALRFPVYYIALSILSIKLVFSRTPLEVQPLCFRLRHNTNIEEWKADCQSLINHIPAIADEARIPSALVRSRCQVHENIEPPGAPLNGQISTATRINLLREVYQACVSRGLGGTILLPIGRPQQGLAYEVTIAAKPNLMLNAQGQEPLHWENIGIVRTGRGRNRRQLSVYALWGE